MSDDLEKACFLNEVARWEFVAKNCLAAERKNLDRYEHFDPELIEARRKVFDAVEKAGRIIAKRREGK